MVVRNLKIGDSIKYVVTFKNQDNTRIDLTGYSVNANAYHETTKIPLFDVSTRNSVSENGFVSITDSTNGEVLVAVKNTNTFKEGIYYCDIQIVDSDGFRISSPSFKIKVTRF